MCILGEDESQWHEHPLWECIPGGALEFSVTGLCPSKNFSSPNEGIFRVNRHPIGEFFIGNDTQ